MFQQAEDLREEGQELKEVLVSLAETDWQKNTPFKSWTINNVVQHLHGSDKMAVLALKDADAFAAFKESGDVFDPEVAEKARKFIYSAGNTAPPDELYRSFRGRDPEIQFMLEKKGLV